MLKSTIHNLKNDATQKNMIVNFFIPLLDLKGKEIIQRSALKEGDNPEKNAEVIEEAQNGQTLKVQKIILTLSDVVGDALNRFIQEPPKPVGQVDYRELSNSVNKLLSSGKPKVKKEDLSSVRNAVAKLQAAQAIINEKTNATLKGKDLLMLAKLTASIYSSEEAIELTKEQVEFIIKAIDKTNNGMMIMRVCELLDPKDKLNVLS